MDPRIFSLSLELQGIQHYHLLYRNKLTLTLTLTLLSLVASERRIKGVSVFPTKCMLDHGLKFPPSVRNSSLTHGSFIYILSTFFD